MFAMVPEWRESRRSPGTAGRSSPKERRLGRWLVVAALVLLAAPFSRAQTSKEVTQQFQFWWSLNTTARFTDRWGLIADAHVRRNDFVRGPSFYLVRFGAHRWLTEKLTLSLGYAHMWRAPECDDCETWAHEDRIYQQVQYATQLRSARVLHRVRNEQRWQQEVADDALTGGTRFSDRLRYLVSFTIPVFARPTAPSLVLSDEILVQFGEDVVLNTFDQNRFFAGIKKSVSRSWSYDLGYMLVYQQRPTGYEYDLNHTLRWFFYYTPDARDAKAAHDPAGSEE